VDGGDLFWKGSALAEERIGQQREKAQLMIEAMSLIGLDAWVPGEADWQLGTEWVLELAADHQVPVLAGNLKCGEQVFPGHRLVERAGRRIGFVGVVDYTVEGCSLSDPAAAAKEAASALGEVDLMVGIFHGKAELDGEMLEAVPDIDFFFNGHTGQSQANPRQVKGAWFLGTGRRGKHIGRLALEWTSDGGDWVSESAQVGLETRLVRYKTRIETSQVELVTAESERDKTRLQRRIEHHQKQLVKIQEELEQLERSAVDGNSFRHSLVDLDRSIEDHGPTAALVAGAKERIEAAAIEGAAQGRKSQLPFVGSETCRACHVEQYAQWKETDHARAWATLVSERRSMDADCFACHVTGAHHPKGPQFPTHVGSLIDVGCEACHGPGERHLTQPVGTMTATSALGTCTDCHDGVKDEGRFDPETYIPQVSH